MESVEVRQLPGRGRGLVARRHVKAGETVLLESPILLTVSQDAKEEACAHCLRLLAPHAAGAVFCQQCRQVAFCSSQCAHEAVAKAWVHAPDTCRAYQVLEQLPGSSAEQQSQLRFLIQAMALRRMAATGQDARYQQLLALQGEPTPAALAAVASLHASLQAALGAHACLGVSQHELACLLAKEQVNAYGVMAPPSGAQCSGGGGGGGGGNEERRVRGGAILPRCSLINHECAPNVARFDVWDAPLGQDNSQVSIRAMHDLPPGTELVLSYVPLGWPLDARQQQLQQVYGFTCSCPRCQTEAQAGWHDGGGSGSSEWGTDSEGGMECGGDEGGGVAAMEAEAGGADAGGVQQGELGGGASEPAGCTSASAGGAAVGDERGPLEPTYLQLFLLKYMCPREDCGGTMAAVRGTDVCECNVCGGRRSEAEFLAELDGT